MLRNTVRGILGLVFVAAATWLANYVTELLFGPERPRVRMPEPAGQLQAIHYSQTQQS